MRIPASRLFLVTLFPVAVNAWGPHEAITHAALQRLAPDNPLVARLGPFAPRLTNYCWMADYRRVPYRDVESEFYAEDYLLFPGMTNHLDHLCPEVRKAYRPYMRRALQALRTEDAANAARWVGSLLHFVEDTGSPPHAAEINGPLHPKMENWVEAGRISVANYRPASLGKTDEQAIDGLEHRMSGLIEFSKLRAQRARPLIEATNRPAAEPIILESAIETSRVVADLLYTLGELVALPQTNTCRLAGVIAIPAGIGMEKYPAKVAIVGTLFSTIAGPDGAFEFQNLPPGTFEVRAWRGGVIVQNQVELVPAKTTFCKFRSTEAQPNLVRNPRFSLGWISPPAFDHWYPVKSGWEGEIVPLKLGCRYRLHVRFRPDAAESVSVVWTQQLPHTLAPYTALPKIEPKPLAHTNDTLVFTATERMSLMQITVRTQRMPGEVCEEIRLTAEESSSPR